jgi:hypothetical protein
MIRKLRIIWQVRRTHTQSPEGVAVLAPGARGHLVVVRQAIFAQFLSKDEAPRAQAPQVSVNNICC